MFKRSRTIFFLTNEALKAAQIGIDTHAVTRTDTFTLGEQGLAGALHQARERYGQGARWVLPERYLYVTQITVPVAESRSRAALEKYIANVFPETLGTLAWDYELLEPTESGEVRVELSGVVKEFGDILAQAIEQTGYHLEALIPESYALAQLVPGTRPTLLVHEKPDGWIVAVLQAGKVITALFLETLPDEAMLHTTLTFAKERKGIDPECLALSLQGTKSEAIPDLGLPREVLPQSLDPLLGGSLLTLGVRDDTRLDIPLRGLSQPWYCRFIHW